MAAAPAPTTVSRRTRLCHLFTVVHATARYSNGVFGGLNRLLAAAIIVGATLAAFVAPSPAFGGCNGRPSAANVYSECLPSAGGGKPARGTPTSGSHSSTPAARISGRTARALEHAGKDKRVLSSLIHGYGPSRLLQPNGSTPSANAPTTLGSAFDLGSGPTAFLIVLAGTALLLLGASGVRGWRRSRRA